MKNLKNKCRILGLQLKENYNFAIMKGKEKRKKKILFGAEKFGVKVVIDPTIPDSPGEPSTTLKIINEWLKMPGNLHELWENKKTK